jgi:hypothetical protein
MKILLDPVAPAGGGASAAPVKPAAAPAAAPSPSPAPAAAAPAAAPEPASDDPFAPPPKPAGAAPAAAPAKPAPVASDDVDRLAPKELRERYKATKAERDTLTKAKTDLEAKIKSFESQGKDTTALIGRLTAIEKERDAALAELRAAKQEASPEFKEKYDKPFNTAAERARTSVAGELDKNGNIKPGSWLTVIANAETGETRPATWEDFTALYSLPVGKAIEQANALFGTSAQFVLGLREKLLDLDSARATALQDEREQFKQRTEKEIAGQNVEREKVEFTWAETNTRLAESVADYKNDPEDTELNDARKHALTVFDSKINAADRQDYITKKIQRDAHIRQRIGAFPVLKLQLTRAQEKITTLQAQVDELKGTAPGKVKRPGGTETPDEGDEDWGVSLKKAVQPE